MLRFLFVRFILPLIAFLVLRAVLKSIWGALNANPGQTSRNVPDTRAGGDLKKDPVCGTYVAESAAVTKNVGGQTFHFCSTACRDKYKTA